MCGIVDPETRRWECGCAPRLPQAMKAGRGLTSGLRGLELAESARVICGRARVPVLGSVGTGPEGERRARSSPDRGAERPGSVQGVSPGRSSVRCPGKAEMLCLPEASVLCGGGDGEARVPEAWVRLLRSQLSSLGSGTKRQMRSVDRSSCGPPGMVMGEEPRLLPPAPLCQASPSLWCWRRGAPGANRGRRYLCSIRRDLFAGGTRRGARRAAAAEKLPHASSGTFRLRRCRLQPLISRATLGLGLSLSDRSVLDTAVFTLISDSLKSFV